MDKTYLSASSAKEFHKSPAHYLRYKLRDTAPTPAMEWGTAVHTFILEPEKVDERYYFIDEGEILGQLTENKNPRATKIYKDWMSDNQAVAGERKVYSRAEYTILKRIQEEAYSNNQTAPYLVNSKKEVELKGDIYGVPFIGYADIIGEGFIADVKTTQSAHPTEFQRSAFNNMYHLQAAVYCELTGIDRFAFIAIEAISEPIVQVYEIDAEYLHLGRKLLKEICEAFKQWDGSYEGYANKPLILTPPNWAK